MEQNMKYPKISMVTTCYNHADYVGKTIESVLSQNYPNLQYIVINDGSTDNSEEVIKRYSGQLSHWETWEGYRPGPVFALNKAFSLTDGEIMGWINSDDILLPNSLFVIASLFNQLAEVEWVTGIASTINLRGEVVRVYPYRKNVFDFLNGNWSVIQQESTFWRRTLWERTGGCLNEDFVFGFDIELWTSFFLQAEHYHLNTAVGAFRKGMQSRSIRDLEEYTGYVDRALKTMMENAPKQYLSRGRNYKFLKKCVGPLLRHFPVWILNRFPGLKQYNYKVIDYKFAEDKWAISEENPF